VQHREIVLVLPVFQSMYVHKRPLVGCPPEVGGDLSRGSWVPHAAQAIEHLPSRTGYPAILKLRQSSSSAQQVAGARLAHRDNVSTGAARYIDGIGSVGVTATMVAICRPD
jgi:hypothetical protein